MSLGVDFDAYFVHEMAGLAGLAADGLVAIDARWITVLKPGMLLLRYICMNFDHHLRHSDTQRRFSRAI